ncbi:MAG: hypothetical protein FJ387_00625 [Verrucomicrobia bacterium]|nr:hypothetical protein [Verrucomicrobiota bacterium]
MNGPRFLWFLIVCPAVGVGSAQPTFLQGEDPKPAGIVWRPVALLSDEFDGETLDRAKWQTDPTANGWGWYGRAPGLFRAENVEPKVAWDAPSFIHMAIETYDWNPIPDDGGLVDTGTWDQRTTRYDWVRTWEPVDQPAAR